MTTLKTVEEIVEDNSDIEQALFPTEQLREVLTQDRQATADVLCALLEKEKKEIGATEGLKPNGHHTTSVHRKIKHNQALDLAQDIIRATLSNEDL